ncbi:hypothetical protein ARMSODRAFT_1083741 [Armillaria solidipes]|uniref:Uncharacterized protein n=1 Tax=Armillaria solidipes TaxID=1076256 RepID=A0A2H3BM25_9AGAR|nr:hypothetical protein ARMSODRAFT_1083741 [Armillaria solidipes]
MSRTYIYTAQARDTGYYITSTKCDIDGQIVATADGNGGAVPEGATLTFNKALEPINTTGVTIEGINGLYVALPPVFPSNSSIVDSFQSRIQQNATSGSKLIWSTVATKWQVDVTSTPGVYEIIPQGQDLYWFTDNAIGPIVQVKKGIEIHNTENQWTLKKCDVPGQIVATADGNGGIPDGATLTFSKALQSAITIDVTIKGINGLYVALPENATSGSKLIWSSDAVNWQVNVTSTGLYEIIPKGQDLSWFTGKLNDIGPIVQVKKGSEIIEKENKWTLNKVD